MVEKTRRGKKHRKKRRGGRPDKRHHKNDQREEVKKVSSAQGAPNGVCGQENMQKKKDSGKEIN